MLGGSRKLTRRDFPTDSFSDLPDLGATTLDRDAFLLAYHCHAPLTEVYRLSTRKRLVFMSMLKELKELEQKEIERASRRKK